MLQRVVPGVRSPAQAISDGLEGQGYQDCRPAFDRCAVEVSTVLSVVRLLVLHPFLVRWSVVQWPAGRLYVSRLFEIRQSDRRLSVALRTAVVQTEVDSTAVWLSAAHRTVGRLTVVRMIAAVRQQLFDFCRVSALARLLLSGRHPLRQFRFTACASRFTACASLHCSRLTASALPHSPDRPRFPVPV